MLDDAPKKTKQRLLDAAKRLFAQKGFAGASVREICSAANAGRNMIHHYFGSKEGLFNAILDEFSNATFVVPLRVVADPPSSKAEMVFKFEYFVRESLEALIEQRLIFQILIREQAPWQDISVFRDGLLSFLAQCQELGFVHSGANIEMVPGMIMDRLGNQLLYAIMTPGNGDENIITNPAYRSKWVKDSVALILFGFVSQNSEATSA